MRAAALTLCSLTLKSHANKTRCATLEAVPILLELGSAWGVGEEGALRIVKHLRRYERVYRCVTTKIDQRKKRGVKNHAPSMWKNETDTNTGNRTQKRR